MSAHSHVPAGATDAPPASAAALRRARIWMAAVVVPLLAGTVIAVLALWPRGPLPSSATGQDAYQGVQFLKGDVRQLHHAECAGDAGDRLPDGSIPDKAVCWSVDVALDSGPEAGTVVTFGLSADIVRSGVDLGDRLQVARYPGEDGEPAQYAFVDFARAVPLGALALGFAVFVVAMARLRGLMSLVGLVLAFAMIGRFVIPALRHQESPVLVGAVAATAIMAVVLYLAHGVTLKTSTALLGTVAGVWTCALLAHVVTGLAHLNGLVDEEHLRLNRMTPFGDLSGLVTSGIIIAGLGVLNDVTITQASAVWEFHRLAPTTSARRLFASGMQVARDHLASIVYTLAFAYAGAALPTILLGSLYGRPLGQWLESGEIAEEIARGLVASLGLVLAIPLTTAIGCLAVRGLSTASSHPSADPDAPAPRRGRRGRRALGVPVTPR